MTTFDSTFVASVSSGYTGRRECLSVLCQYPRKYTDTLSTHVSVAFFLFFLIIFAHSFYHLLMSFFPLHFFFLPFYCRCSVRKFLSFIHSFIHSSSIHSFIHSSMHYSFFHSSIHLYIYLCVFTFILSVNLLLLTWSKPYPSLGYNYQVHVLCPRISPNLSHSRRTRETLQV